MRGRRTRVQRISALVIGLALLPGCTADERPPDPSPPGPASSGATSEEPAPELVSGPPVATPVERAVGALSGPVRARDGTTLVQIAGPRDADQFRIYDRRWRPITPVLEVAASLSVLRGLRSGFVARVTRVKGPHRSAFRGWVTIGRRGAIRVAERPVPGDSREPVRPGDIELVRPHEGALAYRPSEDAVVRVLPPAWFTISTTWYTRPTGTICAVPPRSVLGDSVRISLDSGATWRALGTESLPAGSGPRLQSCEAQADRVAVMTGGEYPRFLHTFDRTTGTLLSSHRLMKEINGYDWTLLSDGTLVAGTNRRGLLAATDNTNRVLEFRSSPVRGPIYFAVVEDDLVLQRRGLLHVSTDRGRTWFQVGREN
jgi:hypothetical protein